MIITAENRKTISEIDIHDACFYSLEAKCINGRYDYVFKASDEWKPEEEFLFVFSGVSSCVYTAEHHLYILESYVCTWYSLPCCSNDLPHSELLTKDEIEELEQHVFYKERNLKRDIRHWEFEHDRHSESVKRSFRIVFFLSTPIAYLEIECEELIIEKTIKGDKGMG